MSKVEYTFYLFPHLIGLNLPISNYSNNQNHVLFHLCSLNSNHLSLLLTNLSKKSYVLKDFLIFVSLIDLLFLVKLFLSNFDSH